MRVLSLISGGKDSCYCMLQCLAAGHEIVALGNLQPVSGVDEMDSFMYQTVGHEIIPLFAEAMSLPLFRRKTNGIAVAKDAEYTEVTEDEVEDLFELLKSAKEEIDFDAVCSGAILSNYQRVRVENVCSRLGLVSLAYLWRRDQTELLSEMILCEIDAVVVKVASLGLNPMKVLNSKISDMFQHFVDINKKYELNICGEGGEYETVTLDCPLFKKKIEIVDFEIVLDEKDESVGFLKIKKAILVDKKCVPDLIFDRIKGVKGLKTPVEFANVKKSDNSVICRPKNFVNYKITNSFINPSISNTENLLWISGLCGTNDSMTQSTVNSMSSLKSILDQHSMNFENIKVVNVYLNSMSNYNDFNQVYKKYFHLNPPIRACVEANLPSNISFLIDCVCQKQKFTKTMHVQSISHWAPANIGPYSQVIECGNIIYTAGQIGLIPGSMELVKTDIDDENLLIFRHISRVLNGFDCNLSFDDVFLAICYTTNDDFVVKGCKSVDEGKLVVCVRVNELPRCGNIEWQVLACKESGKFDKSVIVAFNKLRVECKSYKNDNFEFYLFSFETGDCDVDIFEFKDVFDELKFVTKDCDVKQIRVFFKPRDCDENFVFCGELGKYFGDNLSIAVVPVTKFATEKCRLILLLQCV